MRPERKWKQKRREPREDGHREGAPATHVDEPRGSERHERERVIEHRLERLVDEGARQHELQQAVEQAGGRTGHDAAADRHEDDRECLKTHRAALGHHEQAQLPKHGRKGHGHADLGERLHAPLRGVEVQALAHLDRAAA